MNHNQSDNIINVCFRRLRQSTSVTGKRDAGPAVLTAEKELRLLSEKATRSHCNRELYTVTVARLAPNNSVEHESIYTSSIAAQAIRVRDDINRDLPIFGSGHIAHLIRQEVMPRQWELWARVSDGDTHLRCRQTNARALLGTANPEVRERFYRGESLAQDQDIHLQSERIQVSINYNSTRCVDVTRGGGTIVTHQVKACPPVVGELDINNSGELTLDTHTGAVARFPINDGTLLLPANLAKAFRLDGIVLPLWDCGTGKIKVRLTHWELLTRLKLSVMNGNAHSFGLRSQWARYSTDLLAA